MPDRLWSASTWFLFGAAALAFGLMPASADAQRARVEHIAAADSVDHFIREQIETRRIPGMQVAVVQHRALVFLGAYGLANVQDSVPTGRRTLFTINSITKAFVGVALTQLVDGGTLDLDAPISQYLDSLPPAWRSIPIRRLATNESGLPNIMNNNTGTLIADGEDAAWAKVRTLPMEFPPGERFSYSQTNYGLLGRVIDKLTGTSFREFITRRQFRVVGMPRTAQAGFGDSHDVIPGSARGYTFFRATKGGVFRTTDTLGNVFEEFPPSLRTAAGLSSTAEELAHWIIALQSGLLLRDSGSLKTLWTPGRLTNGKTEGFSRLLNGYALGWEVAARPRHRAFTAIGGGRSALFVYPDDDLAVVVLTNLQGSSPESFIDTLAGYFFGD
jgi:CubicO group peptidase (beta-lactamase class C family)